MRFARVARAGFGIAIGMVNYPAAWFGWLRPKDELANAVSELLLIGFHASNTRSPSARLLARQVQRGQVGGVYFVAQNIDSRKNVSDLVTMFRNGPCTPLLAIDHEGGAVQRLNADHEFTRLPKARDVAATLSPEASQALYCVAGAELARLGFNVNLGPVLDVDRPTNPAIGAFGRAYHTKPEVIAAYGGAFVSGFTDGGILCAAKHFPGHGKSTSDSHDAAADISTTWTEKELDAFARLIASPNTPPLVMVGHLRLDTIAPDGMPATVSPEIVTGLLRERLGYDGVVVTDDLDMGAISHLLKRRDAFIQAIAAGNDLIMIQNLFRYDPLLPQRAVGWVRKAISLGQLSEAQVMRAAARVRKIRRKAHGHVASST